MAPSNKQRISPVVRLGNIVRNLHHDCRRGVIGKDEAAVIRRHMQEIEEEGDTADAKGWVELHDDLTAWSKASNKERNSLRVKWANAEPVIAIDPVEELARREREYEPQTWAVSRLIERGIGKVTTDDLRKWKRWEYKNRCMRPGLLSLDSNRGNVIGLEAANNLETTGIAGAMFLASEALGKDSNSQAHDLLLSAEFAARNPYRLEVLQKFLAQLDKAKTTQRHNVQLGLERLWDIALGHTLYFLARPRDCSDEHMARFYPTTLLMYCFVVWKGHEAIDHVRSAWEKAKKTAGVIEAPMTERFFAQLFAHAGDERLMNKWKRKDLQHSTTEALLLAVIIHGGCTVKNVPLVRKMLSGAKWEQELKKILNQNNPEATACITRHLLTTADFLNRLKTLPGPEMIPFVAHWIQGVKQLADINQAVRLDHACVEDLARHWATVEDRAKEGHFEDVYVESRQSLEDLLYNRCSPREQGKNLDEGG